MTDAASQAGRLAALLQLSSPALPIGGYSYSQGFEAAVDRNIVTDEASAGMWINNQLDGVVAPCEAPIWLLSFDAWAGCDFDAARRWNAWFHASRETHEVRQETEQMGWSLARLAGELRWGDEAARNELANIPLLTLPAAHAFCAYALGITREDGLTAYLFTWLENQIMAAIKAVPLGQLAGQRILDGLRRRLPAVCEQAHARAMHVPPRLSTLSPQFAILSSRHETQYSRLFRS